MNRRHLLKLLLLAPAAALFKPAQAAPQIRDDGVLHCYGNFMIDPDGQLCVHTVETGWQYVPVHGNSGARLTQVEFHQ